MSASVAKRWTRWPAYAFPAAATLLLALMALLQITSIRQEAQTYDEAVYISAGYAYWTTGDFRLNPEHPPLAKLLVALPLLLFHDLTAPLQSAAWKTSDQYAYAAEFIYKNRVPADTILFASRCVTIVVTLTFGLLVALWTKRRAGTLPALVALALFAFDPNILAHGRYATNDLYLAFFFFLAPVLWNRALRRDSLLDYGVAGIALGLACCTNVSGLLLVPIFALLCIRRTRRTRTCALGSVVAAVSICSRAGTQSPQSLARSVQAAARRISQALR